MKKTSKLLNGIFRNKNGFCLWPISIFYEMFRIFILRDATEDVAHCCCNCCCDAFCQDTCGRRRSCIRCS
ncbi:MAG: hypothetical protein HZR80_01235 [Candidatus Heimdallarchaeota archaeon]